MIAVFMSAQARQAEVRVSYDELGRRAERLSHRVSGSVLLNASAIDDECSERPSGVPAISSFPHMIGGFFSFPPSGEFLDTRSEVAPPFDTAR